MCSVRCRANRRSASSPKKQRDCSFRDQIIPQQWLRSVGSEHRRSHSRTPDFGYLVPLTVRAAACLFAEHLDQAVAQKTRMCRVDLPERQRLLRTEVPVMAML